MEKFMKKLLIIIGLFLSSYVHGQFKVPDTLTVMLCYSDTACKFDKGSVMSMYNSRCILYKRAQIVHWMYFDEFLMNKKPLPGNFKVWYYKPIDK